MKLNGAPISILNDILPQNAAEYCSLQAEASN